MLCATALIIGILGMFCTLRPYPTSFLSYVHILRQCLVQWTWHPSPTLRTNVVLCSVAEGSVIVLVHEFLDDRGSTCTVQGFPRKEFLLDRTREKKLFPATRDARRRANLDGTALPIPRTEATSESCLARIDASMRAPSHPPFQSHVRHAQRPSSRRFVVREYSVCVGRTRRVFFTRRSISPMHGKRMQLLIGGIDFLSPFVRFLRKPNGSFSEGIFSCVKWCIVWAVDGGRSAWIHFMIVLHDCTVQT